MGQRGAGTLSGVGGSSSRTRASRLEGEIHREPIHQRSSSHASPRSGSKVKRRPWRMPWARPSKILPDILPPSRTNLPVTSTLSMWLFSRSIKVKLICPSRHGNVPPVRPLIEVYQVRIGFAEVKESQRICFSKRRHTASGKTLSAVPESKIPSLDRVSLLIRNIAVRRR